MKKSLEILYFFVVCVPVTGVILVILWLHSLPQKFRDFENYK